MPTSDTDTIETTEYVSTIEALLSIWVNKSPVVQRCPTRCVFQCYVCSAQVWNLGYFSLLDKQVWIWHRVTYCAAGYNSARSRPHQLCWGNREIRQLSHAKGAKRQPVNLHVAMVTDIPLLTLCYLRGRKVS